MTRIAAAIAALMLIPEHKQLAEELKAELGSAADTNLGDVVKRMTTAEAKVGELTAANTALADQVKQIEPLQTRVKGLEGKQRVVVIKSHFGKAALENGINPDAVETALQLANLDGLEVDLDKGTVNGLTKELFDGLKSSHKILATPAQVPTIKPAPANGGKGNEGQSYSRSDMATGKVKPEDIVAGKVQAKE